MSRQSRDSVATFVSFYTNRKSEWAGWRHCTTRITWHHCSKWVTWHHCSKWVTWLSRNEVLRFLRFYTDRRSTPIFWRILHFRGAVLVLNDKKMVLIYSYELKEFFFGTSWIHCCRGMKGVLSEESMGRALDRKRFSCCGSTVTVGGSALMLSVNGSCFWPDILATIQSIGWNSTTPARENDHGNVNVSQFVSTFRVISMCKKNRYHFLNF